MKPEYTLHKLPEGFFITSNEEVKELDQILFLDKLTLGAATANILNNGKIGCPDYKIRPRDTNDVGKLIAQQHQIDFSALKEKEQKMINWFDTWSIAKNYVKTLGNSGSELDNVTSENLVVWGFQKAQELMADNHLLHLGKLHHLLIDAKDYGGVRIIQEYLQSLIQPKSWKVELEMEMIGHPHEYVEVPKLTDGKIKLIEIVKNRK